MITTDLAELEEVKESTESVERDETAELDEVKASTESAERDDTVEV